jgi:hypothetical protein
MRSTTSSAASVSAFANNHAFPEIRLAPNEFLQLAFASGISKLTVAGDPAGGSFVLDDLSFTPTALPAHARAGDGRTDGNRPGGSAGQATFRGFKVA